MKNPIITTITADDKLFGVSEQRVKPGSISNSKYIIEGETLSPGDRVIYIGDEKNNLAKVGNGVDFLEYIDTQTIGVIKMMLFAVNGEHVHYFKEPDAKNATYFYRVIPWLESEGHAPFIALTDDKDNITGRIDLTKILKI